MTITSECIQSAPAFAPIGWLRLLAAGWPTTVRFHEARLAPCFACNGTELDTVTHFLTCTILWEMLSTVTGVSLPTSIAGRLALDGPDDVRRVMVGVATAAYDSYTFTRFSGSARRTRLLEVLRGKWQHILIKWASLSGAARRLRSL